MKVIFNNGNKTVKEMIDFINTELIADAPYVRASRAALGDDTIMLLVSFEPKESWRHGYVENSNYFRMAIYETGEMEVFTQSLHKGGGSAEHRIKVKFRKCTVKTEEQMILKLKTFIQNVKENL
jgi:hypothetical protein